MMTRRIQFIAGLIALHMGAVVAYAQETPQPAQEMQQPGAAAAPPPGRRDSTGLEAESRPAEISEAIDEPHEFRLGPTPVSDVSFLMDYLRLRDFFGDSGIRTFGWVEGGYSGARRAGDCSPSSPG